MTKIICTIGRTKDVDTLVKMINEGMSIARFNFSHGDWEEHQQKYDNLKKAMEITGKEVKLLGDTKGIEIRLGRGVNGAAFKESVKKDDIITFTATDTIVSAGTYPIPTLSQFVQNLGKGDLILIDDGKISCSVIATSEDEVTVRVLNDGVISQQKSINIPGVHLDVPYVSEYDKEMLMWCYIHAFDYIALSFCRTNQDLLDTFAVFEENGIDVDSMKMKFIPKLEDEEGVDNFGIMSIDSNVAGIMIARGDLGVEIPQEKVPTVERKVVKTLCKYNRKFLNATCFSIVATQMLDSMCDNPRPTRAEVNDVYTAVELGADYVMLSGETASGDYPVESVRTMRQIIEEAEKHMYFSTMLE